MSKPTEDGWYWYKHNGEWEVVKVSSYSHTRTCVAWLAGSQPFQAVGTMDGQWGPKIEPPWKG